MHRKTICLALIAAALTAGCGAFSSPTSQPQPTTAPATATSVLPTIVLPTATTSQPTATSVAPTGALPTATSVQPIIAPATATSVPPTPTRAPATATSIPPSPTKAPATATSVPPTATRVPATATSVPPTATSGLSPAGGAAPTWTPLPATALAAELTDLAKTLLPKPPATPGPGRMDIAAMQLKTNLGNLWLAYSTGMRAYQPLTNHFLAIYTRSATGWQMVSKLDIPGPDYVNSQSIRQVQLDAERIWLQVDGGAGAHSGVFSLVSFDGQTLRLEIEHTASSPGGSRIADVNGDKMSDVVLDQTDYYVFCYACGVRYFSYTVMRWDGTKLAEVKLTPLPDSAPADLRLPVNQAVALAQAGLWKEAQETIATVQSADPTVAWNAGLIQLHSAPFARQAASGPYPLLDRVFYGDYAAALDAMRPYTPEQIFAPKSPLITVDVAQGWEKSITQWMTRTTTLAIGVKPDLAAAYYLRGWAINLGQPGSAVALADIEKAAQLDPKEPLFAAALQYLRSR